MCRELQGNNNTDKTVNNHSSFLSKQQKAEKDKLTKVKKRWDFCSLTENNMYSIYSSTNIKHHVFALSNCFVSLLMGSLCQFQTQLDAP